MLAFSVFILLIAESIPATSETVSLIGIYLTITMSLTSTSIILTVFILQLHYATEFKMEISRFFYNVTTKKIAWLVGLSEVVNNFEIKHNLKTNSELLDFDDDQDDSSFLCSCIYTTEKPIKRNALINKTKPMNSYKYDNTTFCGNIKEFDFSKSTANLNGNERVWKKHYETLQLPSKLNDAIESDKKRLKINSEWKLVAMILDRLLFWIFFVVTTLSSSILLLVFPILKNKDLLK